MRLLFDKNISYRVVKRLKDKFPDLLHINQIGLGDDPNDIEIWQFAKRKNFIIVSHDNDFEDFISDTEIGLFEME